jgi:hypothetical protein
MNYIKAKFLLNKISAAYAQQKVELPKEKIKKKIEAIKYLSSQKKVPRLSLRKEVINLENQLENIYLIEKALLEQKKNESVKVAALKRQISRLKGQCSQEKVKELQKTINQLSNLLAESLAKQKVAEEVKENKRMVPAAEAKDSVDEEEKEKKVSRLQQKLILLRWELEKAKKDNKIDPMKISSYEQTISAIQEKLREEGISRIKPKHTVMFHTPPPIKREV